MLLYLIGFPLTKTAILAMLLSYIQAKGDPKQTARRLRIAVAEKNANYVCTQDGKTYTGEELRHGITVTACTEDEYSRIWHFVRK